MKPYDILKDFPGSQDGRVTEEFKAGTQVMLSDYLAEIVVREGWARPVAVESATPDKAAPRSKGRAKP